jgi:hypothetical protein
MSTTNPLGFGVPRLAVRDGTDIERVIVQRPLQRVLAFLGYSIDDVCNDPIVRNQVIGYYKLHREVLRTCEVADLERQWNPTGISL